MKLNIYRYLIYSTMKVNFLLILFGSVDVDMKLEVFPTGHFHLLQNYTVS